jgi:ATP-dependent Clp protease ATP-binding subunit ClpA
VGSTAIAAQLDPEEWRETAMRQISRRGWRRRLNPALIIGEAGIGKSRLVQSCFSRYNPVLARVVRPMYLPQ